MAEEEQAEKTEETGGEEPQEEEINIHDKVAENLGTDVETEDLDDYEEEDYDTPQPVETTTYSDHEDDSEDSRIRKMEAQLEQLSGENQKLKNQTRGSRVIKEVIERYPNANAKELKRLASKGVDESVLRREAKRDQAAYRRALKDTGEQYRKTYDEEKAKLQQDSKAKEDATADSWGTPDVGNKPTDTEIPYEKLKHKPLEERLAAAKEGRLKPREETGLW